MDIGSQVNAIVILEWLLRPTLPLATTIESRTGHDTRGHRFLTNIKMKEAANLAFAIQLRTTLLRAPNAQHVVYQAHTKIAATIADEAQNHDPQRVRPSQWYPKRQNHQASDHKVRF